MTYYVAKSGRDQMLPYICMNDKLNYHWFRSIDTINPHQLTCFDAEESTTLQDWLDSVSKHSMTLLYSFTEESNPELFI